MLNRYATGLTLRRGAEVAALYHRAFPPSERVPLPLLCLASLRRGVDLEVYEEGSAPAGSTGPAAGGVPAWGGLRGPRSGFAGFTYTVQTSEVVFLLFLAVDEALQGRGYGSQILGDVLERAGRRPVVLEIEPLDPGASNIGQRYRRLAFYQRHGLRLTGYDVVEGAQRYSVLSSSLPFHVPALGRALRSLAPRPLRLPGLERTRFWPEQVDSDSGGPTGTGDPGSLAGATAAGPTGAAQGPRS
ncbi:GNAT family N-acetyltransferase [Actinomyces sp. 2119]|uniref:GNAT family N-acetyltransferase n=1 Tax=Actinomyces sp. 2119 TaxID=2321393 RepID=UPI000E6CA308|nr:GNAT family N-acetyltransferase [Actinomyces sp. 2119]RJF41450.1 GNAT family N-acetyltransferase [Actinomyces sp. 2119]